MKRNIQGAGRLLRGLAGLIFMGLGWYYQSWWGVIGLIPLAEGLAGWCVLRAICGRKG